MGSSSEVVFIIITILMILSLYFTNILIASASLEVQKVHLVEKSGLGKFRALLGLSRSSHLSPSPAPAPSPTPSSPRGHQHSHFPLHHSKPKLPILEKPPKEQVDKKGRYKKVLMAVLFSSGAAFLMCLLGSIWVIRGKLKRHNGVFFKTMSAYRRKDRTKGKMSLNSDLDFLYLDALGRDLEQQTASLKQNFRGSNNVYERVESDQELIVNAPESESNTCGSSSTRNIMSINEEVELDSVHNEPVGGNSSEEDRILPIEVDQSSDDESFHSLVDDLPSSNARLSNASSASLFEVIRDSPRRIRSPSPSPSHSKQSFVPPPPPPPTIPPPRTRFLTSNTPSKPQRTLCRTAGSPTLLKSHSSGSSQSFRRDHSQSPRNSPRLSSTTSPRLRVPPPPIAPSPPPSPFSRFNVNSSSSKGPQPPPSKFPPPMGKDGTPLAKLKPLHWDKVRAAPDGNMVWDKIRSSSFELDEEMMESLFGYNLQIPIKGEEGKSKSPSPSKHVIDPKRLQNITILSKAINSSAEQVCDALIRGDGLSQTQLEALSRMTPTKEEETKISAHKGNINELGSAEKFVILLLSLPFAFPRVEAMLYRETFEDEVVHLRNSFSMLEDACKELRSSRLFLKLLEAVLKTGNRMNVGTIRGGAKAFKLDTLLKLADVKGTDGKTTLLHFVVQEIVRSEGIRVSDSIMGKINQKTNKASNSKKTPEEIEEDYKRMGLDLVSGLTTELYSVKKTATIDLELLGISVSNLSEGMARLNQLVGELGRGDHDRNERFVATMKGFLGHGERALRELREDEEKVLLMVREVTKYFHGDSRNVSKEEANPLRIFVIVRDFLGMLDHVCKELRSLKVPSSPNPLAPFR